MVANRRGGSESSMVVTTLAPGAVLNETVIMMDELCVTSVVDPHCKCIALTYYRL